MMRLSFVTLFPELIRQALEWGVVGKAIGTGAIEVETANPRDFATDARKSVDDTPFGGGPGMLMRPDVFDAAIQSLTGSSEKRAVVATDSTGAKFNQSAALDLSQFDEVVFLCGRYEGIDERVLARHATHRFSIGDFILSGGELPALVMADAIARCVEGTLGDAQSLEIDSFSDGLLSAPQYTRPEVWDGESVPEVLRSGDHGEIAKWKRDKSLRATRELRPELFALCELEKSDIDMLSS